MTVKNTPQVVFLTKNPLKMNFMNEPMRIGQVLTKNTVLGTPNQQNQQPPKPGGRILTEIWAKKIVKDHNSDLNHNLQEFNIDIVGGMAKHVKLVTGIANNIMRREGGRFEIDEHNEKVLQFLLLYFHQHPLAEKVFENQEYKLKNNLLITGTPGTGKTMLMQIFSEYLKRLNAPQKFENISTTQLMNYYKINSHIDRFTYNEEGSKNFGGSPISVCLNDIGDVAEKQKSYGTSLTEVVDEFLFARYEIYQNKFCKYHLTSNLNINEFRNRFEGRLMDRFKSFNVIQLGGKSRRK